MVREYTGVASGGGVSVGTADEVPSDFALLQATTKIIDSQAKCLIHLI